MVRYAILGPVELCDGERRVEVGGPRQVALLALLLVNANRALSTDWLIDALWCDRDSAGLVKRLRMAIVRLRRTLDPDGVQGESVLRTTAGGYLLTVRPGELDADVFQTRAAEGRSALQAGEVARAREVLREALAMWRGPALADVAYEQFAQPEIRRLEELRLAALEARVDCELQLREHAGLIGELEALVAAHPGRERLAAQLMLALYRCGRQGDALDAYARTRAYLSGELGLEPGPALVALQAEILAQSPALQPVADAPPRGAGAAGRPSMISLPRALRAPAGSAFVGRDAELERLHGHWTQMAAGERAAVLVRGEPGIGKTRLAAEFAQRAYEEGVLVLYGRCDEGLAVPYQPFVEALGPYVRAVGPDRLRAGLEELAPNLGHLLPEFGGLGKPVRSDPESERFALFEAVATLIETATRHRRALLVLDDLHWATRPTLLLVRHLLRCEQPLEMLLLCMYRQTELELGEPLAQLVADVQRDASAQLVSLTGLELPAIATLLEAAMGHALHDHASPLVRGLAAHTGGNPFFLRELLADVAESGPILPGEERMSLEGMATRLEVPEGLRHVIGQRVARLSAPAGRALRVAAVAAVAETTFSFTLLERVLGEESGVLDALDEALAAGLLAEAGRGAYVFAHALVRQTIYNQLSTARRMRLHRQLGEVLEHLDEADTHVEALAHHYAQAAPDGQGTKAADYALAAGHHAIARLGYEEAAAHYERGLQTLGPTGQPRLQRRCDLSLALGEARWAAGQLDGARAAYGQAANLAEKLGDTSTLTRAALGVCGPPRFETAVAVARPITSLLQRALAALADDDSAQRAQLMARLAAYAGATERKPVLARQALEMARRVADTATFADVLASTLLATQGPDTLQDSMAMARELATVADVAGDRQLLALAHLRLLDCLLELGDINAVDRELDALHRLAEPRRERYFRWLLAILRANHAHLTGRIEDSERLTQDAFAQRFEGHDESAEHAFGVQMLFVRREQGRLNEVVHNIEDLAKRYPDFVSYRYVLAYLYTQLKLRPQTRQQLEALAANDFRDIPRDAYWLANLSALSEVVAFLNDPPRAQLLYKLLLPYANRCVIHFALLCQGSASRPLGLLATTLSRYDDAQRHFEQALTMNAQIRSPLWTAYTQHDHARMLLQRDRPADRAKALELLNPALHTAEQLGLKALADKARTLKLTAEATVPPPTLSSSP